VGIALQFMKKLGLTLLAFILLFVGFLLVKTFTFTSRQLQVDLVEKVIIPDSAIERLQKALRIKTISFETEEDFDSTQFEVFNQFLKNQYPSIDSLLDHKVFNEYSHLYKWQGSNGQLKPIVLMGHIDVVAIASPDKWSVDPFSGEIKDGKIWGRGTIDDKFSVIGILEAVEMLL
jgi:carboxypeptidase PM20D1